MARLMVWARYTTETGAFRACRIQKAFRSLASMGFGAFDEADLPIKPDEMRYATLADPATGRRRRVPIGSLACDAWTGVASTLALPEVGSADPVTWTIIKRFGENLDKAHAVIHPATATSD